MDWAKFVEAVEEFTSCVECPCDYAFENQPCFQKRRKDKLVAMLEEAKNEITL